MMSILPSRRYQHTYWRSSSHYYMIVSVKDIERTQFNTSMNILAHTCSLVPIQSSCIVLLMQSSRVICHRWSERFQPGPARGSEDYHHWYQWRLQQNSTIFKQRAAVSGIGITLIEYYKAPMAYNIKYRNSIDWITGSRILTHLCV